MATKKAAANKTPAKKTAAKKAAVTKAPAKKASAKKPVEKKQEPTYEQIAELAHRYFHEHGGTADENWLRAERELKG